ncbi:MAG: hypothetical protein RJA36_1769 [Pseudomonadota bacterium]|jgi:hypothetical protein
MTPILGGLLDAGLKILEKVIPDPGAKAQAQLELLKLQQAGEFRQIEADLQVMLAQTEVNKVEAAQDSFRGGWRPAVGWVCVSGMAYTYLGQPLLAWVSATNGWAVPPTIDTFDLLIMLGGMLGFGGMRSFERIKGKA